jgi:hypothetical protein
VDGFGTLPEQKPRMRAFSGKFQHNPTLSLNSLAPTQASEFSQFVAISEGTDTSANGYDHRETE